jgi:hypothetical protein
MPYVFLVIGLALAITAIEGTYKAFGLQLKQDFTDKHGFQYWALAICLVGALGYIQSMRPISNKLLWLVLVALFLANGGAWSNLVNAFKQGAISPSKAGAGVANDGTTKQPWQTIAQDANNSISAVIPFQQPQSNQKAIPGVNEIPGLPDLKDWKFFGDVASFALGAL